MPTITGRATPAIPDTRHVPLPTGPSTYRRTPRPSTSPFAGKPVVEFTDEQLARAGYRLAGTGSEGKRKGRTDRQTQRDATGAPIVARTVDRDRIVAMKRAGATIAHIHRTTGYAHATIRRHLDAAGVDRTPPPGPTDAAVAAVARLYADGLSIRQVADRLDLGYQRVRRMLDAHPDVTVRDRSEQTTLTCAGREGVDNATALRDLLAANDVTAHDVREWAADQGRDCPARGVPPRALVEDYLLARGATPRADA